MIVRIQGHGLRWSRGRTLSLYLGAILVFFGAGASACGGSTPPSETAASSPISPSSQPTTAPAAEACSPKRANPLPDEQNGLLRAYKARQRYYLVVGASVYPDPQDNRQFVEETAVQVAASLDQRGYKKLGVLLGKKATTDAFRRLLRNLNTADPNVTLLIYYAGHAVPRVTDPLNSDLYLQFADQSVEEGNGVSVGEALDLMLRKASAYPSAFPRVILVIDSCYSGTSLRTLSLWRRFGDKNVVVMTSSSDNEKSWPYRPDGTQKQMTAFGHFFTRALGSDWSCADRVDEGALEAQEITAYAQDRLTSIKSQLEGSMSPDYEDPFHHSVLVYDPTRRVSRGFEGQIVSVSVDSTLAASLQASGATVQLVADGRALGTLPLGGPPSAQAAEVALRLPEDVTAGSAALRLEVFRPDGSRFETASVGLNRLQAIDYVQGGTVERLTYQVPLERSGGTAAIERLQPAGSAQNGRRE